MHARRTSTLRFEKSAPTWHDTLATEKHQAFKPLTRASACLSRDHHRRSLRGRSSPDRARKTCLHIVRGTGQRVFSDGGCESLQLLSPISDGQHSGHIIAESCDLANLGRLRWIFGTAGMAGSTPMPTPTTMDCRFQKAEAEQVDSDQHQPAVSP